MPQPTTINPPQKPRTTVLTDATGVNAVTTDGLGNLNVNVQAGGGGGGSNPAAAPTGAPVPVDADYIGAKDSLGNLIGLSTDGSGNLNVNLAAGTITGGNAAASATGGVVPASADYTGFNKAGNLVGVSSTNPLPVDGSGVTQPVSGTVAVSNFPATQPVSGSVSVSNFPATQPVSGTVAVSSVGGTVAVDGSATTQPISGSVSVSNFPGTQAVSGTVTGNQGTAAVVANAWPIKVTDGTNAVTVASLTNSKALAVEIVDGAGTQITSFGGGTQFADNAASGATPTGTLSMGWDSALSKVRALKVDASQNLDVNVQTGSVSVSNFPATQPVSGTVTANIGTSGSLALDASVTGLQVAQSSTTAGEKGTLVQGAVTTAAPAYTTAQTSPLSLNTAGGLRVDGSGVTQPISGTVTTTPPSNASTNVAQINGVTPLMGNGVTGTGSQRVTIASDNTAFAVNATLSAETTKVIGTVNVAAAQTIGLAAGAAVIGHVIADTGSTTAVTGNVTVVQPTGTNLHTVVDSITPPTVTKGTQGATGFTVQSLCDAGRTQVTLFAFGLTGTITEALTTMSITKGVVAQTAATSYTVTAGKTFRIQSIRSTVVIPSTTGCSSIVHVRSAASAIAASSPVIAQIHIGSPGATALSTGTDDSTYPNGLEIAGGTQIACTHLESSAIAGSATTGAGISFCIVGYEY